MAKLADVYIKETVMDDTVAEVKTNSACIVLKSPNGRINTPVVVGSPTTFVRKFGKPRFTKKTQEPDYGYGMYGALEYLSVGDRLTVVRVPTIVTNSQGDVDYSGTDTYASTVFGFDPTVEGGIVTGDFENGIAPYFEGTSYSAPLVPNKIDKIVDIDMADLSIAKDTVGDAIDGKFVVSYVSPSDEGNNVAIRVEFFSKTCDWLYNYDTEAEVDLILNKINENTPLTESDIEFFTASKVFKLSVYTKSSKATFDLTAIADGSVTASEVYYCSTDMINTEDGTSLFIEDVVNGGDTIYINVAETFTASELLQIINNATILFTPKTGANSDLKNNDNFVVVDEFYVPIVTGIGYVVKPLNDEVKAIDLATITSSNVERVKTLDGRFVKFDTDTKAITLSNGIDIDTGYEFVTASGTIKDTDNNKILKGTNGVNLVFPFKELVKSLTYNAGSVVVAKDLTGGKSVASSDVNNTLGFEYIRNKERVQASILILPTYSTSVKQYVANNIVILRNDLTIYTQSGDITKITKEAIVNAESYGYMDASYLVLSAGYYRIRDTYNNRYVFLPLCIADMKATAYTDVIARVWDAPAGETRGTIGSKVMNIEFEDEDFMYLKDAKINFAQMVAGRGYVIMSQDTALKGTKSTGSINVRRNLIDIKNVIYKTLKPFLFEINNSSFERRRIWNLISNDLTRRYTQGGLERSPVVICDDSNNPPSVVDQKKMRLLVAVKPIRSVEEFEVNVVVTPNGIDISEAIKPFL